MVIQDLSPYYHDTQQAQLKLAPVGDRLLAFSIDFFLFSPVIHLLLSFLLRKIEVLRVSAPDSLELISLFFVAAMITLIFVIAVQTVFLRMWGGTPGKLFLKLRVVSSTEGARLSLTQAIIRSVLWVFEALLFFVPFLEILSHAQRRALHDRGAETMVITLKASGDNGPHALESHFIRQVLMVFSLLVTCWIFFGVGRAYHLGLSGAFKKSDLVDAGNLCQYVDEDSANRVDEALGLFLADAVSDDCVLSEADFAMWTVDDTSKAWGFLAMAVVSRSDAKLSQAYLDKVCEHSPGSEPCGLANNFQDIGISKDDEVTRSSSLTAQVLRVMRMERDADFAKMPKALSELDHAALLPFKLKHQAQALWSEHSLDKARGVFEGGVLSVGSMAREEISAWMCIEELQLSCSPVQPSQACSELSKGTTKDDLEIAWAAIKSSVCSKTGEASTLTRYKGLFEKRKDFRKLVDVVVNPNQLNSDRQNAILQDLVENASGSVSRWALGEWIEHAHSSQSWEKILSVLKGTKRRDWVWQRQTLKAFQRSYAEQAYKQSYDFVDLVKGPLVKKWGLQEEELVATYKAGNLQRARQLAKAFPALNNGTADRRAPASSNRSPASEDSFTSVLQSLRSKESP
jgi:uncharacterized RDD family membrane protein YckC